MIEEIEKIAQRVVFVAHPLQEQLGVVAREDAERAGQAP